MFPSNTVNKTRRRPLRRRASLTVAIAPAQHRSGCQTPRRNQPAKLAARAICARAVVGNSDGPRFAAWQEDRCGPPAAARPLLAWLAQQLRHNAGRFDRHRRPPRANDRREGAPPVRYVRPCPLMPSVTMGIDAAVTANTNSSNTATREINAAPNFFRVQVFGALKIPTLKRRGRSSSALGSMQFCPRHPSHEQSPASVRRAIGNAEGGRRVAADR